MIYADHCATTALSGEALEMMLPYMKECYGNPSALYDFGKEASHAVHDARNKIADLIHAEPEEIYFTSGGSEGDNWVLQCTKGDIIVSSIEHHAVLNTCKKLEKEGRKVSYLPVTKEGIVTREILETALHEPAGLVSIMLANNELGTIEPIEELAAVAHEKGALFMCDAVQGMGHIPIDVKSLGVDFLVASAHKFNGPKGVGFIYVKKDVPIQPLISGGGQEYSLRAGTENVAGIVGMAYALEQNIKSMEHNENALRMFEDIIIRSLNESGIDYRQNGSMNHLPGVLNLSFRGIAGESLLHRLNLEGICVSTGSACDSKNINLSHVLEAIQADENYAYGTIRISLGMDNTLTQVQTIAETIERVAKSIYARQKGVKTHV